MAIGGYLVAILLVIIVVYFIKWLLVAILLVIISVHFIK
jgi:hypothetical protein